jgi:hypothetical protein
MKTLYLSGPMTGYADFNFPAFHAHAKRLRHKGYTVLNPAENFAGNAALPRETYLREDLGMVLRADAVAVLPRWNYSKGARLEVAVARAIGLPVLTAETLEPVPDAQCRLEVMEANDE